MRRGVSGLRAFTPPPAPTPDVLVSGPPSSGTRLVARLLAESGHTVRHDGTHGRQLLPAGVVVTTSRQREPHVASLVARGMGDEATIDEAVERIAALYPDAPCVSYEALILDRDIELSRVARLLGWPDWVSTIEVTDENRKHLT